MAVDHDAAGHLERCACRGAPLSQPFRRALEGSYQDKGIPIRDQRFGVGVCVRFGIGIDSDADYADQSNNRRSVSGMVVALGGVAVSWASSSQGCVTLSTTEAGYVVLGEGVKEALFTGAVLSFVCPEQSSSCVRVFEDNQVAVTLVDNTLSSARSKHIDVRFHFVGELLRAKRIDIQFVALEEQPADVLTKYLAVTPFKYHSGLFLNLPLEGE